MESAAEDNKTVAGIENITANASKSSIVFSEPKSSRTLYQCSSRSTEQIQSTTQNESDKVNVEKVGNKLVTATPSPGEEPTYITGLKLYIVTIALYLALFLVTIDRSIIAPAIPKITSEFHSLDNFAWYNAAFSLTSASFQLTYGTLYTLFSIKWTFLVSVILFEVGSIICGVAPNSVALILGRAIAGLGSGGIYSGALVIVSICIPMYKRPLYMSMIGAMSGIAAVLGPVLGGIFTDKLSWRWCFYINYPFGAATILIITFLLNPPLPTLATLPLSQKLQYFDLPGTIIFIPCIVCLLLALQWGGITYTWSSWRIILLFVLFSILIIIWLYIQYKKGERATLKFRILKMKTVTWGVCASFINGAVQILVTWYLPIYFQAIKNDDAIQSGVDYIPTAVAGSLFAIIGGLSTTKIGYCNPQLYFGTVMLVVGTSLIYSLKIDSPSSYWIGAQIPFGAGMGVGIQQPIIAVQNVLSQNDISAALSTLIFSQTMGGVLAVTIGQTVFNNKLRSELTTKVPDLNPEIVINQGASGLRAAIEKINPEYVQGVLVSYMGAVKSVFLIALVLACLTAVSTVGMPWNRINKGEKKVERLEKNDEDNSL